MIRLVMPTMFALALLVSTTIAAAAQAGPSRVLATYTLPDARLGATQNAVLPGSIANDRGIHLGGISDLWRAASDPADEYWTITDRGPNGQIRVGDANRRTFPVPGFTPLILRLKAEGGALRVLQTIPIVGHSGRPVTGMSNLEGPDEAPYDYTAQNRLPYSASGLDTEGIVRTSAGEFWLCDEYTPSLVKVDRTGKVVKRYVPRGVALPGADYPVVDSLPAIYAKRKVNRGFEGIALSQDERTVYAVLQSPLLNPNAATGNASRNTRVLAFDTVAERPTAEWAYRFDAPQGYGSRQSPDEMKLSGVVAIDPTSLLILERTDEVAKIYRVDTRGATDLLGGRWGDPATAPTFESLADPATAGITVLPKTLVVDLSTLPGMPGKVEGVAVVNPTTLAVTNDNDFDIGNFDAAGNLIATGAKNQLLLVSVPSLSQAPPAQLPRTGGPALLLAVGVGLGLLTIGQLARRRH